MIELYKFIKDNIGYFLLLLFFSAISVVGLFLPCIWITILGIILSFVIASINKWKSYKNLHYLDKKISEYDEAFQTERNADGTIKSMKIGGGTF